MPRPMHLGRRRLVWTSATANPTSEWIARQITEAFPCQAIEELEVDGGHDEEINGGDVRRVIADEGLPFL